MEARPYTSGRKGVCLYDFTNKVVTVPLKQQADQTARALDLWLQSKLGQIAGQDLRVKTICCHRTSIARIHTMHYRETVRGLNTKQTGHSTCGSPPLLPRCE